MGRLSVAENSTGGLPRLDIARRGLWAVLLPARALVFQAGLEFGCLPHRYSRSFARAASGLAACRSRVFRVFSPRRAAVQARRYSRSLARAGGRGTPFSGWRQSTGRGVTLPTDAQGIGGPPAAG